jgi:hypothetical protein
VTIATLDSTEAVLDATGWFFEVATLSKVLGAVTTSGTSSILEVGIASEGVLVSLPQHLELVTTGQVGGIGIFHRSGAEVGVRVRACEVSPTSELLAG